jgi:hypothetical protein
MTPETGMRAVLYHDWSIDSFMCALAVAYLAVLVVVLCGEELQQRWRVKRTVGQIVCWVELHADAASPEPPPVPGDTFEENSKGAGGRRGGGDGGRS